MKFDKYKLIKTSYDGRVLTLTLNRPAALNAVNNDLHEELSTIFYDVAKDPDSDVVILTGEGRAFCVGGDLSEMKQNIEMGKGDYLNPIDAKRIVFSMLDLEKPIVAMVNGDCIGLGATLALLCDIIFVSQDAKIADPHVKAGVVAGDGGAFIWPQLIGYARSKEFLMLGDVITPKKAEEMGLINAAVPRDQLEEKVKSVANRLASGPRDAIKWTKTVMNIPLKQIAHTVMDASVGYEWQTFRQKNHEIAIKGFLAKEPPIFNV